MEMARVGDSPTAMARRGRAAVQIEESPAHIQDPKQRKKVQNRIAQRTYRKKIKTRMEALESFREASTAQGLLSEISSPEFHPSDEQDRRYPRPLPSPVPSTPSIGHSYGFQDQSTSSKGSTSISSSERGESHTPSFSVYPDHAKATKMPSLKDAHSFKRHQDGPTPGNIWDLSRAIDIGLNVEDVSEPCDTDYYTTPDWSSTDLMKEFTLEMCLNDQFQGQDHKTALHMAAEKGKTSTVQLLLSLQPDILAQDATGRTALHLAVYHKHQGCIEELLKRPICLEVRDRNGQTALHIAAAQGYERAVACLLAAGANLECKDAKGQTAFHLAAANGRDNILQLLFMGGADINAKMNL